jgi:hypothetical protein
LIFYFLKIKAKTTSFLDAQFLEASFLKKSKDPNKAQGLFGRTLDYAKK